MTEPTAPKPARPAVSTKRTIVISAATAALVYAAITPFTGRWEGTDLVAKRDMIGTGHPITYCHGQTAEFGNVKVGQRFTPAQCDVLLAKSLPKYLTPLLACIHRDDVPVKVIAAALDADYNAGPNAVCHSPMVAHINAGNFTAACNSFAGWYIRASGRVVQGLINRRNAEKKFCLQYLTDPPAPAVKPDPPWWQRLAQRVAFWRTA